MDGSWWRRIGLSPVRFAMRKRLPRRLNGSSIISILSTNNFAKSSTICLLDITDNCQNLASGHLKNYPRVFGVAWAFVAHTDSRFDPDMLRRFVMAYQCVQPLTIGELWAVAISLRVVLVENLRRLIERIVHSRD